MVSVAVIGAGMAGLACADKLLQAGLDPVVFDKGRGIGGRMSTRRISLPDVTCQFDHGAQYLTARSQDFAAFLADYQGRGFVAPWYSRPERDAYVGISGMSSLPRAMAQGLDIRQEQHVRSVDYREHCWEIEVGDESHSFDRVVVAVPANQVAGIIGPDHPIALEAAHAVYAPCLTLMALVKHEPPFANRRDDTAPLSWIACDNSKPKRPVPQWHRDHPSAWVAHGSVEFSAEYLEEAPEQFSERMVPLLLDAIDAPADALLSARGHRWRYARVTQALSKPYVKGPHGIYGGGDWCLGARVEDAYASGCAVADALLNDLK